MTPLADLRSFVRSPLPSRKPGRTGGERRILIGASATKSSFPWFAPVPRSDLDDPPAIRPTANVPRTEGKQGNEGVSPQNLRPSELASPPSKWQQRVSDDFEISRGDAEERRRPTDLAQGELSWPIPSPPSHFPVLTAARTKRPHNGKYVTASFQSSCELHAIAMTSSSIQPQHP